MSSADLWEDNYPHGTPEGYDGGCKGGACPAGVRYGLSCKIAKSKSNGDVQYRRLVKAGESVPAIADALGLIGSEPSAAVAKKAPAPVAAPRPKPAPTPATVKGGVSLADAAASLAQAAAAGSISISDLAATTDTSEKYIPAEGSPQAKDVWKQTAEILGAATPPPAADAEDAPAAAGPSKPAPAPKSGEIRAWARSKGYDVAATGKLPKYIVDHYWDATGRLTLTDAIAKNLAANKPQDPSPTAADTDSPETETTATAADTIEPAPANPTAPDDSTPAPDEQPEAERPDWGTVAAHVDVEAARNLAVRLEQELARSEEQRTTDRQHQADSLGTAHNELWALRAELDRRTAELEELSERLSRRTAERVAAEERADTAESALQLAIAKWGEERAATESSYAVILDQARTINILTDQIAQRPRLIDDRRYAHGTEAIIAVDEPIIAVDEPMIAAGPTTATIEELLTGQAPPATFPVLATAPRRPWHRR